MNRAIAKKFTSGAPQEWETSLFTPPASVSPQEHYQIERRIDEWAESLVVNPHFDRMDIIS